MTGSAFGVESRGRPASKKRKLRPRAPDRATRPKVQAACSLASAAGSAAAPGLQLDVFGQRQALRVLRAGELGVDHAAAALGDESIASLTLSNSAASTVHDASHCRLPDVATLPAHHPPPRPNVALTVGAGTPADREWRERRAARRRAIWPRPWRCASLPGVSGGPPMDFAYPPKVEALRAKLRAFMDGHVVPRLADWQREVEAGAWPPSMIEPLKGAGAGRGPVEPVPARPAGRRAGHAPCQPGVCAARRDHGPRALGLGGLQLLGARHRQHGALAHVRHARAAGGWLDPLLEARSVPASP